MIVRKDIKVNDKSNFKKKFLENFSKFEIWKSCNYRHPLPLLLYKLSRKRRNKDRGEELSVLGDSLDIRH